MYDLLISVDALQKLQAQGQPLMVFDCSFELMQPAAGPQQYEEKHVAGAVYAHLDTVLSAKNAPDAASGGRHPLPSRETFAAWLGSVGFSNEMQAVVYDRQGVNYCGRMWWMLKWLGHEAVAVLDGGLQAWQAAGGDVRSGSEHSRAPRSFALHPPLRQLVDTQTIASQLGRPQQTVLDARAPARYRGEMEPIDPVAGHIPGALNRPFNSNIAADGKFKPADQLRAEFATLLGQRAASTVVHHCGSGVSALPNLMAMEIAGLGPTALYAGSWSEWCNTPGMAIARG